MKKLFKIRCGKVADSGFITFLVYAEDYIQAVDSIINTSYYNLSISCEEVIFNNNIAIIEDFDNPNYEG